jgi:adenylyl- and sulfurtransferase ThiI
MEDRSSGAMPIAILFSGGRDSTLAALIYHRQGKYLHLLSFDSGLGYGSELREIRVRELQRVFGENTHVWRLLPNYGLVKRICFSDIVTDIKQDGCQLILLGESLAMLARAIDYCLANGIRTLAIGASGYQAGFAEQTAEAIEFFRDICKNYGLTLTTPVLEYTTELQVKERLLSVFQANH